MVARNSKVRRLEDLKGATIGVSQYGSEADTFTRNALATVGLKPDKDVTILQLGGHPQVAAAMVAGKLDVGALAGLPAWNVEKSGGRLLSSAVELKILSPSGTFATTRGFIQRKRNVVERLTHVELTSISKSTRRTTTNFCPSLKMICRLRHMVHQKMARTKKQVCRSNLKG